MGKVVEPIMHEIRPPDVEHITLADLIDTLDHDGSGRAQFLTLERCSFERMPDWARESTRWSRPSGR